MRPMKLEEDGVCCSCCWRWSSSPENCDTGEVLSLRLSLLPILFIAAEIPLSRFVKFRDGIRDEMRVRPRRWTDTNTYYC